MAVVIGRVALRPGRTQPMGTDRPPTPWAASALGLARGVIHRKHFLASEEGRWIDLQRSGRNGGDPRVSTKGPAR